MMRPTTRATTWAPSTVCVHVSARSKKKRLQPQTYHRHLGVAKLVPQILDGVQANKSGDEEPDQLNTSNKADAQTGHEQPEKPLGLEAVAALVVELGPAESGSDGAKQEHRVEEDEAADGGVRVFAENHQGDEPDGGAAELKLLGGPVGHGHADGSPEGIELAHEGVVDLLGVRLARLELEGSIVTGEVSAEADEELSGRGLRSVSEGSLVDCVREGGTCMHVEVEFALQIVAAELSKTVGDGCQRSRRIAREGAGWTHWASSQVTIGERPIL